MKKLTFLVLVFLLQVAIIGCGQAGGTPTTDFPATSTPGIPVTSPRATDAVSSSPTPTLVPAPTVSPSPTSTSTQTPTPTLTPSPSPAPTPTQTPILTPTPSPTPTPPTAYVPKPRPELTIEPLGIMGQIGGPAQAMAVDGNHAYLGVGMRLVTLDVTNPVTPREVGSAGPFGWYVEDAFVVGNTAFVVAGQAGLYAVDISDPARPAIVGSCDTPGYAEGVTVAGDRAYVADGPAGLQVVDVSDKAHPVRSGSAYTEKYVFEAVVKGGYAYLAAAGAGLLVCDVSVPDRPREVGGLGMPGYAYALAEAANTVYVADGWGGLRIVDISDPKALREAGSVGTSGWARDVAVDGNTVYLADGSGDGYILDASDRGNCVQLGSLWGTDKEMAQYVVKLAAGKHVVYGVDQSLGVHITDVTNRSRPVRAGLYQPVGQAGDVAVGGNYAYLSGSYRVTSNLRTLDVADPRQIQDIPVLEKGVNGRVVHVEGGFLYMFGWRNDPMLQVFDLANPFSPKTVGLQKLEGPPVYMFITNGKAYVTTEYTFEIVDISNPRAPFKSGVIDFAGGLERAAAADVATGVAVSGGMAYVLHSKQGLMTIDVTDPGHPTVVNSFKPPQMSSHPLSIVINGDVAYVGDAGKLLVVDIAVPQDPRLVTSLQLDSPAEEMILEGKRLYVADGPSGMQVIDVSNPRQPGVVATVSLPGNAIGIAADNDFLYVACDEGGLIILGRPDRSGVRPAVAGKGSGASALMPVALHSAPMALSTVPSAGPGKDVDSEGSGPSVASPAIGRVLVVNSAGDSGPGTLRSALQAAAAGDTISFDPSVFPPRSPVVISPAAPLPYISQGNLTIDASNAGVILDGSKTPKNTHGLVLVSDHNTVKGLEIRNFSGVGIGIAAGSFNTIGGDRSKGNGPSGEGNVTSANTYAGIGISHVVEGLGFEVGVTPKSVAKSSTDNRIIGNYIGLDASGNRIAGNQGAGVRISGNDCTRNVIGGDGPSDRNVISGNVRSGINFSGKVYGNTAIGNYVGTDASGLVAMGKQGFAGIANEQAHGNTIKNNLVSGNDGCGVLLIDPGGSDNNVVGNLIGTDRTGMAALGNGQEGVAIMQSFNKVGGITPEERNIISGNKGAGVRIGYGGTTDAVVTGNYVGTDLTGTRSLRNADGILLMSSTYHSFIGGTTAPEANLISGNNRNFASGVFLSGAGVRDNFIMGNNIGTNAGRTGALPNTWGITVRGARNNFIIDNTVTSNVDNGIGIVSGEGNRIYHNTISGSRNNGSDSGRNNLWDDGQQGNYWGNYTGQDSNGDGIGDTPCPVLPNGVDRYPLTKPSQ